MSKFSRKYGYDKKGGQEIMEDAPEWTRMVYVNGILTDLIYIDLDSRYPNSEDRPIGIKTLHKDFTLSCRIEMDDQDMDSWYCQENLIHRIKNVEWYYFYDLVELVGKKLKQNEGEYIFETEKLKKFGSSTYIKKVNELFKEDNIVWELNEQGELMKKVPEILNKLLNQVEGKLVDSLEPARIHYKKAFKFIFSFPTDTENGIKEIVSAVESTGRTIYPKASTLGDVIKEIRKEKALPEMLIPILEKYYIFANATPAVRHGSSVHSNLVTTDGEFAFYVGVAMIRYLIKIQEKKNVT